MGLKGLLLVFSSQKVVSHAEGLWERMKDRGDKEFPITHDGMKVIWKLEIKA